MGASDIARMIEGYMTDDRQEDIDKVKLGEPYVVKGIFMDESDGDERLEGGILGKTPLVQIRLGDVPKYEDIESSYLVEGYSGTIYG